MYRERSSGAAGASLSNLNYTCNGYAVRADMLYTPCYSARTSALMLSKQCSSVAALGISKAVVA
jgi:hypothetical protein